MSHTTESLVKFVPRLCNWKMFEEPWPWPRSNEPPAEEHHWGCGDAQFTSLLSVPYQLDLGDLVVIECYWVSGPGFSDILKSLVQHWMLLSFHRRVWSLFAQPPVLAQCTFRPLRERNRLCLPDAQNSPVCEAYRGMCWSSCNECNVESPVKDMQRFMILVQSQWQQLCDRFDVSPTTWPGRTIP